MAKRSTKVNVAATSFNRDNVIESSRRSCSLSRSTGVSVARHQVLPFFPPSGFAARSFFWFVSVLGAEVHLDDFRAADLRRRVSADLVILPIRDEPLVSIGIILYFHYLPDELFAHIAVRVVHLHVPGRRHLTRGHVLRQMLLDAAQTPMLLLPCPRVRATGVPQFRMHLHARRSTTQSIILTLNLVGLVHALL